MLFRAGLLQNGLSRIRHIQVDQSAGKVGSGCRGLDYMVWRTDQGALDETGDVLEGGIENGLSVYEWGTKTDIYRNWAESYKMASRNFINGDSELSSVCRIVSGNYLESA